MRVGEVLGNRYEVRKLWRRVGLLLDLSTGRQVVTRPVDGFASREAIRVLEGTVHPSLPRVFGEMEMEGKTHILFEYLPGDSLDDLVNRAGGALEPEAAASIMLSVARTVRFLHESLDRPLVHLDIKPEHIVLSGGVPCLIDFSSAILLADDRNGSDGRVREATPVYAAPEASVWQGPCVQSDIYSLGVTLFRTLGGAFPGSGRLPDLRDLPGQAVPAEMRRMIGRCLLADPAARYPGMSALESDLAAALEGRGGMGSIAPI